MGLVGRVISNSGDRGDQVYLVPSNFCNWRSFYRALWEHIGHPQTSKIDLMGGAKEKRSGGNGRNSRPTSTYTLNVEHYHVGALRLLIRRFVGR